MPPFPPAASKMIVGVVVPAQGASSAADLEFVARGEEGRKGLPASAAASAAVGRKRGKRNQDEDDLIEKAYRRGVVDGELGLVRKLKMRWNLKNMPPTFWEAVRYLLKDLEEVEIKLRKDKEAAK